MWSVGRKAAWLWRNCLDGTLRPARNPEQARHSQCRGTLQGSHVARPGRGAGMRSRNTSPSAASLPPTPATSDSGANGPSVPCLLPLHPCPPPTRPVRPPSVPGAGALGSRRNPGGPALQRPPPALVWTEELAP